VEKRRERVMVNVRDKRAEKKGGREGEKVRDQ